MQKFINGLIYLDHQLVKKDFAINDQNQITFKELENITTIIDLKGLTVLPGFIDLHVHSRNPGFSSKEDLKHFNNSLLYGGFTHCIAQSNTNPLPDTLESIADIQKLLDENVKSNIIQAGRITKDGKTIKDRNYWKNVNFLTDDGYPVSSKKQMVKALKLAKKYDVTLLLHEQDENIHGVCYESDFAKKYDFKAFDETYESNIVKRDLGLNYKINAKIHFQHLSAVESIVFFTKYKEFDLNISAEFTPHHLVLDTEMIKEDDGNYKMNPPLPTPLTRKLLKQAFSNEIVNIIATDHAPHSVEEKAGGFQKALNGIIGLESAFGLINKMVQTDELPLRLLVNAMSIMPGKLMKVNNELIEGNLANLTIVNLKEKWIFSKEDIKSKAINSPFIGTPLIGRVKKIIINGKLIDLL